MTSEKTNIHCEIKPSSIKQLKQLLVSGYVKNCITSIIPIDIVSVCYRFYDEAIYYIVNTDNIESQQANDPIIYDTLDIHGIKIIPSFVLSSTNYGGDGHSCFYLNFCITKHIRQITAYFELFCQQNGAEFKKVNYFSHSPHHENDEWIDFDFPMFLKYTDFTQIYLGIYIDILAIKYSDDTLPFYKQIYMKKKMHFQWKMDKALIKKFTESSPRQIFESNTFDEINNNWCLWMVPMGCDDSVDVKDRRAEVMLYFLKRPHEFDDHQLILKFILTNSYNDDAIESTLEFDKYYHVQGLGALFGSDVFNDIESLTVELELEVLRIDYTELADDCQFEHIFQ